MPVFPEDPRHKALVGLIKSFIDALWDTGYHFSDFCRALADYANSEAVHPEEKATWQNLSLLFRAAAQEAETEGRELP